MPTPDVANSFGGSGDRSGSGLLSSPGRASRNSGSSGDLGRLSFGGMAGAQSDSNLTERDATEVSLVSFTSELEACCTLRLLRFHSVTTGGNSEIILTKPANCGHF